MPKPTKVKVVEELTEKFSKANSIFFTNYRGMDVQLMSSLRRELRGEKIEYKVAKKTLSEIAAKNAGYDSIGNLINGQMGIAFSYDDPTKPAKVINSFVKKNKIECLGITGGIFEKQIIPLERVVEIVNLPTREELVGKFAITINIPMSDLVAVLNAAMSNFVGVLKSLAERKK
jgi:large subunit ribosomal protein L10